MSAIGLLGNPYQKFTDVDGNPLVGGFVYTYTAGTTTPLTTYFDSDLAIGHANTNPIELDSAGACVMYVNPTPAVKILVQDADTVEVYSQDDISPAAVAS